MINMDVFHSGGHDFNMRSFVEDHMSREDLGQGTSNQDWTDLQHLGRELLRWEDKEDNLLARNRWSYMPPGELDKKDQRPRPRGRKDKNLLLRWKYQSKDGQDNMEEPRIQEDGRNGQGRRNLDSTPPEELPGTQPRPSQHC